jgi:hypothetical protein
MILALLLQAVDLAREGKALHSVVVGTDASPSVR